MGRQRVQSPESTYRGTATGMRMGADSGDSPLCLPPQHTGFGSKQKKAGALGTPASYMHLPPRAAPLQVRWTHLLGSIDEIRNAFPAQRLAVALWVLRGGAGTSICRLLTDFAISYRLRWPDSARPQTKDGTRDADRGMPLYIASLFTGITSLVDRVFVAVVLLLDLTIANVSQMYTKTWSTYRERHQCGCKRQNVSLYTRARVDSQMFG